MARVIKRLHPHGSKYERKTIDKEGQQVVKPIERNDFDEMCRLCLVRKDQADKNTDTYYRWYRNYIMLLVGVNTGCRITTIIEMVPRDWSGGQVTITEHKTGKRIQYKVNKDVFKEIDDYIKEFGITPREYMFRETLQARLPITRQSAWKMIKKLAGDAGIKYEVGTHSLRKSFGRWMYDETHDLLLVQKLLGHESAEVTQRYICLEPDNIEQVRSDINYTSRYNK